MNENVCIYLRKSRADQEAELRGEVKLWPDTSGFS